MSEGLGLTWGKPAVSELPRTRRALPAPRCGRLDDQGLAVDLAEARRCSLRELYSAAAAPDRLFGMALCALPALHETARLVSWSDVLG